jgi:predicted acyltransferase
MSAARLRSLDVFRGATVALMILVNNPGSWSALYPPLAHAQWHGITPTDLVFPFFLFAVGNALALVMPGFTAATFWPKVLRRTALIFLIGLLLNASPFVRWDTSGELVLRSWDTLRLMGVLQRIALCFDRHRIAVVGLLGGLCGAGRTGRSLQPARLVRHCAGPRRAGRVAPVPGRGCPF